MNAAGRRIVKPSRGQPIKARRMGFSATKTRYIK